MPELIITLSDGRRSRHKLAAHPEVIGRDANCEIPLDDPSTSRRHARFTPTPEGYIVEDLGSKNGTLVNDRPCTNRVLSDGDKVLVGAVLATYHESSVSAAGSVVIAEDATQSHGTHYVPREKRLLLSQQRLEMIYELSGRLTTLQSQDQLYENAMDICFEMLHFERGALGVRRRNSRLLDWAVVRHLQGEQGELTISRTLLNRALEHGERAIFTDTAMGTTDPTVSMVQQGIRSAMCVPLLQKDEVLGVIYGDSVRSSTSYSSEDIDFFAGIAQQVSIGLMNWRLLEDQREMARLSHDLDLARTIQQGLFPREFPNHSGLSIAALNEPGQRVSGDYYDVIDTSDGRLWCLVADVTGEGVAAAMLTANLQAAVRVTIQDSDDPGVLLNRWNNLIYHNTDPSKFITCVLALIDPGQRTIRFASAGHHLPLIVRASQDRPQELEGDTGFPLGVVEDADFVTSTAELGADPFTMFCYTDGVIEAMDPQKDRFGDDRLLDILGQRRDSSPQMLVKHVRKEVASFAAGAPQSDDITMLAAHLA